MVRFLQRRVVKPVLDLLRVGATPERLAWSFVAGVVVGVNPLLGSTTVLALGVATVFGLNIVASQLANHLVYPLELLLFPVWVKAGSLLFRTRGLPLERHRLFHMVKEHPWVTTRMLWRWEWHALVVWAVVSAAAALPLHWLFLRLLRRMSVRLHDEAVVEK